MQGLLATLALSTSGTQNLGMLLGFAGDCKNSVQPLTNQQTMHSTERAAHSACRFACTVMLIYSGNMVHAILAVTSNLHVLWSIYICLAASKEEVA